MAKVGLGFPAAAWPITLPNEHRMPELAGEKPKTKRFAGHAIGYFDVEIPEVRTEEGKLYLFVAINRTSKSAPIRLEKEATPRSAADFLRSLVEAVAYQIDMLLTDNGILFYHSPRHRSGPTPGLGCICSTAFAGTTTSSVA